MDNLSNPEFWSLSNLLSDVILPHVPVILPQVPNQAKYECDVKNCQKSYTKKDKLTKHKQTKHLPRPELFSCPTCAKKFNRQDSLGAISRATPQIGHLNVLYVSLLFVGVII